MAASLSWGESSRFILLIKGCPWYVKRSPYHCSPEAATWMSVPAAQAQFGCSIPLGHCLQAIHCVWTKLSLSCSKASLPYFIHWGCPENRLQIVVLLGVLLMALV